MLRSLAPQTIGETARRQFLSKLQNHYPSLNVSIRRGHFDPDVGLTFEGIRIAESTSGGRWSLRDLVRIERLTVVGSFDTQRMMDQQNPIVTNRIIVQGVQANAWLDGAGDLSLAKLMPLPSFGPGAPRTDIRSAKLSFFGEGDRAKPIDAELQDVVVLKAQLPDHDASSTGSTSTAPDLVLADQEITLRGIADFVDQFAAKIVIQDGNIDTRLSAGGIRIDRAMLDRLPSEWTSSIREIHDVSCALDAKLAAYFPASGTPNFQLESNLYDGRFSHPSLPYSVTGMRGKFQCDPKGVKIEAAQALLGDALVLVHGHVDGYDLMDSEVDLDVSTRGLMLDRRIASSLPIQVQEQWNKIQPVGRVDIDAKLNRVDRQWEKVVDLTCNGVDVQYEKFPYPVEQVIGKITMRGDTIAATNLSARVGGRRMQCAFRIPSRPGLTPEKSFVISTDGPVPINEALLNALSPMGSTKQSKMEKFVRSLEPSGSIQLANAIFITDKNNQKTRKIDLSVVDGGLRYDQFAYRLYNVAGTIKVDNDLVHINGFRATNANAGAVQCDGLYRMPTTNQTQVQTESRLALKFRATNVLMDESLRQSLPASSQQVWDAISPSGILDQLDVRLTQMGSGNPLAMDITAEQIAHDQVTNRTLSLRPPALPYRIDVTGGKVRFDGSKVWIDSLDGRHDASKLSANGMCSPGPDGRWVLALDLHSGSRLHPDAELIASLPPQMREAMRRLQLRGPVSVRGKTQLALPSERLPQTAIDWDLVLQLEGNRIADVGPVHSIRGGLSVRGHSDQNVLRAEGQVNIDSMHAFDQQIAAIHGPFSIVDDRLTLGDVQTSTPISGELFDGKVDMNGDLLLSSGNFDISMAILDAQVPTLLAEYGYTDQDFTGELTGQAQLQGNLETIDLLKGTGAVRMSGANMYKLPFLIQVMNLLRISPSEDHAFTDAEMEFTLFGDTVTFSDMQIWGELVTLHGGGTLDHRRELDLTFNTRVSPKNTFSRVFRPLNSQRYTLWTIDVRGPMANPQIERRALDGVSETLGRWFPGRKESSNAEFDESGSSPRTANGQPSRRQ
ncbi:AsmA-like C-terminal region-containing protein [Rubripirellula amarantea]|nr:AsmA-like C-terminal region-containing protein [Rubripirellula amarantea]